MRQISRRSFVTNSAVCALTGLIPVRFALAEDWTGYDHAIVIDGLGGPGNGATKSGEPLPDMDLQNLRQSGLTALNVTILPVGSTPPDTAFAQAVREIIFWESEIDRSPQPLARIRTVADISAAKETKRTGLIYGFQDGVAFETDLTRLND
ncbi:membrane dipeptidase, partial [bacterium]|nr:membrane dipeptidase [bacterium]